MVLAEKPVIANANEGMEVPLLDHLLHEIGALSSVLHRPIHSVPAQPLAPPAAAPAEPQPVGTVIQQHEGVIAWTSGDLCAGRPN